MTDYVRNNRSDTSVILISLGNLDFSEVIDTSLSRRNFVPV